MNGDLLKIAVPNKGSLAEAAASMLREAGYRQRTDAKELVLVRHDNHVRLFYSKDDQGLARAGSDFGRIVVAEDQHVAVGKQRGQVGVAAASEPLAEIQEGEGGALMPRGAVEQGRGLAQGIAAIGFELEDVRAEICEQPRAPGCGGERTRLEDAKSRKTHLSSRRRSGNRRLAPR